MPTQYSQTCFYTAKLKSSFRLSSRINKLYSSFTLLTTTQTYQLHTFHIPRSLTHTFYPTQYIHNTYTNMQQTQHPHIQKLYIDTKLFTHIHTKPLLHQAPNPPANQNRNGVSYYSTQYIPSSVRYWGRPYIPVSNSSTTDSAILPTYNIYTTE